MVNELQNNKITVNVELKEYARLVFLSLKKKLAMENNNDVIRYAIVFTEKRTK